MNKCKKFGGDKKIKTLCDGTVVIIYPTDISSIIPLFCKCCERPMKTLDDKLSFRKHGICHKCDDRWTNKPNIKWPEGPNKMTADWKKYIHIRNLLEKPMLDFK